MSIFWLGDGIVIGLVVGCAITMIMVLESDKRQRDKESQARRRAFEESGELDDD